jgi:hypothetical protein
MMYFASAIYAIYPNVGRTVGEEAFDADGTPVQYDRQAVEQHAQLLEAKQSRAAAFTAEADPLLFKYVAGEVDKADWIAKREEIRQRFPDPLDAATTTEEVTS